LDPFPYGVVRSGIPLRNDLQLLVFEKSLDATSNG